MSGGTEAWTFKSEEIADSFDNHVRTQLPFYDMVLDSLVSMIKNFLPVGGIVTDMGCATGNLYFKLREELNRREASYHGIDGSDEMVDRFKSRIKETKDTYNYNLYAYDLDELWDESRDTFPSMKENAWAVPNVVVMNLTYMFLDPETRHEWLDFWKERVKAHGAVIIVDKCREERGHLSTIYQRMLWDFKSKHSTLEEIIQKELSLRGVQIPEKRKLFLDHGFEEWFRYGDFSGFIYLQ